MPESAGPERSSGLLTFLLGVVPTSREVLISILTPVSFLLLVCSRNTARSVIFEAAFETGHCSRIFHFIGNQVPIVNDSAGEKVPSNLQPSCFCHRV